jgi:hypothetical protein
MKRPSATPNKKTDHDVREVETLLKDVLRELASEMDLHYEDDDMVNLEPTMSVIKKAEAYLQQSGSSVPGVVTHVLRRFRRHYN